MTTTTDHARTQRQEMARCCELAGVVFIGTSSTELFFRRQEGEIKKLLRIPLREATPLRILLELCDDHSRSTNNRKADTGHAQPSRHLIAAEGR